MTVAILKTILNSKLNSKKLENKKCWEIKQTKHGSNKEATIYFYGIFTSYKYDDSDITTQEFVKDLKEIGNVDTINIRINSPGGNVWVAKAIASLLRSHESEKVLYVDAIAASAATFFLDLGNVTIARDAFIMIHNALTIGIGNKNDFRSIANDLDKIDDSIANVYNSKTGKDKKEITTWMDDETLMNAEEALNLGFVDQIDETMQVAACIRDDKLFVNNVEFDVKNLKNISKLESHLEKLLNNNKTDNVNPLDKSNTTSDINNQSDNTDIHNTEDNIVDLTLEILNEKAPQLVAQIKNEAKEEGIKAERQRLQDIEDLKITGHSELVQKAKFENCISAQELAVQVLQAENKTRQNYSNNSNKDAAAVNNVTAADTSTNADNSDEYANLIAAGMDSANANKIKQ